MLVWDHLSLSSVGWITRPCSLEHQSQQMIQPALQHQTQLMFVQHLRCQGRRSRTRNPPLSRMETQTRWEVRGERMWNPHGKAWMD